MCTVKCAKRRVKLLRNEICFASEIAAMRQLWYRYAMDLKRKEIKSWDLTLCWATGS